MSIDIGSTEEAKKNTGDDKTEIVTTSQSSKVVPEEGDHQ